MIDAVEIAPKVPAAAAAALVECMGKVLRADPAGIETVGVSVSSDVIELPPEPGDTSVRRELGQQHVTITINMKPGARALWVDKE